MKKKTPNQLELPLTKAPIAGASIIHYMLTTRKAREEWKATCGERPKRVIRRVIAPAPSRVILRTPAEAPTRVIKRIIR